MENTPAPRHFIYQVKMWNGKLYLSSREGVFQLDPVTNHFTFLFKPESYCINFDIDAEGNFYANQADQSCDLSLFLMLLKEVLSNCRIWAIRAAYRMYG